MYTDGSKSEKGCGAGFFVREPYKRMAFKLSDDCSIFQCEIFAIHKACEFLINLATKGKRIAICIDSQAAIKSLNSHVIKSKVVFDCHSKLSKIANDNEVKLIWIPGHTGIEGNEIADTLANQGAELHISRVINIPSPLSQAKADLKSEMDRICQRRWKGLSICKTARLIWPSIDYKISKELINLDRTLIKKIFFAVSGHWPLGKHGIRLKLQVSDKCPLCDTIASEIDTLHYWGKCPSLAQKRFKFLGSYFFDSLQAISRIDLKSKVNFIKHNKFFG